jgi:hypothetical protein
VLVAVVLAAVAVVVILAVAANRYQPLGYGSVGSGDEAFPGLPAGHGIRPVNDLGGFHQDMYIPPQRGTFSLFADIANNGTHPVTITAASWPALSPFTLAGPVRYSMPGMGGSNVISPPDSRVLREVVLRPGQEVFLGFPVRMWPCSFDQGWEAVTDFYVKVHYLMFTHTVAVPWGMLGDSLLVRSPYGRPGRKGVTCAPGTTAANLPKVPAPSSGPRALAGSIIRIDHGRDVGELRLIEMSGPDAAAGLGGKLPACFLQQPPDLPGRAAGPARARRRTCPGAPPDLPRRADYRVVNFDLNYADINVGQHGIAPAVHVTISGLDGRPAIAAFEEDGAGNAVGCRTVSSLLLGRQTACWQLVYGVSLRLPLDTAFDKLRVTVDGAAITVPLVAACGSRGAGADCFPGDELGGPWISGTRYSIFLRV